MLKKVLPALFILFSLCGNSQRVYFLYFQSDNGKPFYTRIDEKIYSSTSSGYLIIPKLRDTIHQLRIGFADGSISENRYNITLHKRDRGFLLKSFGEKGWGLFDLQDMSVTMPVVDRSTSMIKTEYLETNNFTDLLARAADDSTLKQKPIMVKAEVKKVPEVITANNKETPKTETTQKDIVKKEEPVVVKTDPVKETSKTGIPQNEEPKKEEPKKEEPDVVKNEPPVEVKKEVDKKVEDKDKDKGKDKVEEKIKVEDKVKVEDKTSPAEEDHSKEEQFQRTTVIRRSESSTTEGFGLVFVDLYASGAVDTIRIMIPNQNKGFGVKEVEAPKREEKRFIEIGDTDQSKVVQPVRNNCKTIASESDFFKLRKRMAAETTDKNMLDEAKKAFRQRCYSTEQVKNLSTLFLRDENKFQFFDLAYEYVTDPQSFSILEGELKETIYINRFKSMMAF